MYYLFYNNYGEYPHIISDIDAFSMDKEMLRVHSVSSGEIKIWREAWDILHLTYYSFEDYKFNQEVKNGK